jgi:hypothetical protein
LDIAVPRRLGASGVFAQRLVLAGEIRLFSVLRRDGADFGVANAELAGVVENGMDVNG